jgi:hypothetical protein
MRRNDVSFINGHFVLHDTLGSPTRFRTDYVEIDVESNVSEPDIDDMSPSQPSNAYNDDYQRQSRGSDKTLTPSPS